MAAMSPSMNEDDFFGCPHSKFDGKTLVKVRNYGNSKSVVLRVSSKYWRKLCRGFESDAIIDPNVIFGCPDIKSWCQNFG
ncbi:hypothetical protein CEXT_478301 [Caerostris extrusa]|uniref:Uncharacterized protein n=1 Tax=Caerostris extrusa TaxID=172846 RepID=A0AAV4UJ18_CAEEX|nr:hypothetical protein CEXT_478301 [Caerostris extrusa]